MDTTLSRSYVTLKLSEIQKRFAELMQEPEGLTELQLEEPEIARDNGDPYNHTQRLASVSFRRAGND